MNENPEGTPNPLNPGPDTGRDMAAGTGPLDFVETANVSEEVEEPEVADTPKADTPESTHDSEPIKPASFTEAVGSVEVEETKPVGSVETTKPITPPHTSSNVVDPMMRPVSHNNFDTLGMDSTYTDEAPVDDVLVEETIVAETPSPITTTPMNDAPELVAKDSIVEPVGGDSRKKILIVGMMILLMIAIICGVAAVAIIFLGKGNDDRVSKAVERLINGEVSSIVSVQGDIDVTPNTNSSTIGAINLDFNGTFDTISDTNTVSAKINTETTDGNKVSISVDELENEDGEIFFKLRGLDSLFGGSTATNSEDLTKITNCINDSNTTNCLSAIDTTTTSDPTSVYSTLAKVIDNQWVSISSSFGNAVMDLGMLDNESTCLVNTLGTLPKYSKDITKKYDANQFITYSTDKLEISKKKNNLYKIGFDDQKLTAFIDSLSNSGFANELNACAGNTITIDNVNSDLISAIFTESPTIYVEVDDSYNFTRVYFKANTEDMAITADLNLTYPDKLEINEPGEYIDVSSVIDSLLSPSSPDKAN